MGSNKDFIKKELVWVCRRLDDRGYTANHDGNVSCRFGDYYLATPTAQSKGRITEDMIITLDGEGKYVEGPGKPFSEIKLHLAAFKARPEAAAVVHAHPPYTMARGMVGLPLEVNVPEAVVSIGRMIPVTRFVMPGTPESLDAVCTVLGASDVFMMPGNGILAIGDDPEQACLRLELVEHLARIDAYARQMGQPMSLESADVDTLLTKRASIGLGPGNAEGASPATAVQAPTASADGLQALIAEEIRKVLQGQD